MPTLIAYSAKLAPRTRSSLLHRYAMDYIRLNEHSAAEDSLKRGKEEAERAAQAEREARSKAEAANRSKSEFLANMSHELRTPLNAIIGFSEMMKDGVMGPLQNEVYEDYSQDIHRSARHLLEVINDVLDLSKIEFGKADLQEADVDLDEAIRACARMIDERANGGQISVEYKPAVAPPLLRAEPPHPSGPDQSALQRREIHAAIGRVAIHVIASEGGGVVVAVVDTGIGIKPADMEKVMAPFGQVDTGLERKYEGTGLGLPLSRAFVEMHDGRLTLESTLGTGTTARQLLPSPRVQWKAVAAEHRSESHRTAQRRHQGSVQELRKRIEERLTAPTARCPSTPRPRSGSAASCRSPARRQYPSGDGRGRRTRRAPARPADGHGGQDPTAGPSSSA